jgi:hypothetical protein
MPWLISFSLGCAIVAICRVCGTKYSKWTAPVSARGVRGACSEVGLSEKPQADPQEDGSLLAIAPITQTEERSTRIRLSSFIPRSRSKVVFALVMGCYCVTLGSFVSVWARVAHVPNPPRAFYLRGDAADIIALLVVAPILESLVLVGVLELVRRVRAPAVAQVLVTALFISELHVWP